LVISVLAAAVVCASAQANGGTVTRTFSLTTILTNEEKLEISPVV
jgi:hypothetical protein